MIFILKSANRHNMSAMRFFFRICTYSTCWSESCDNRHVQHVSSITVCWHRCSQFVCLCFAFSRALFSLISRMHLNSNIQLLETVSLWDFSCFKFKPTSHAFLSFFSRCTMLERSNISFLFTNFIIYNETDTYALKFIVITSCFAHQIIIRSQRLWSSLHGQPGLDPGY